MPSSLTAVRASSLASPPPLSAAPPAVPPTESALKRLTGELAHGVARLGADVAATTSGLAAAVKRTGGTVAEAARARMETFLRAPAAGTTCAPSVLPRDCAPPALAYGGECVVCGNAQVVRAAVCGHELCLPCVVGCVRAGMDGGHPTAVLCCGCATAPPAPLDPFLVAALGAGGEYAPLLVSAEPSTRPLLPGEVRRFQLGYITSAVARNAGGGGGGGGGGSGGGPPDRHLARLSRLALREGVAECPNGDCGAPVVVEAPAARVAREGWLRRGAGGAEEAAPATCPACRLDFCTLCIAPWRCEGSAGVLGDLLLSSHRGKPCAQWASERGAGPLVPEAPSPRAAAVGTGGRAGSPPARARALPRALLSPRAASAARAAPASKAAPALPSRLAAADAALSGYKHAKCCPACGTPTKHPRGGHGCHHIAPGGGCTNCHTHWCYTCGREGAGRCANGCPTFCSDACDCLPCEDCKPGKKCNMCDGSDDCAACHPPSRTAAAAAATRHAEEVARLKAGGWCGPRRFDPTCACGCFAYPQKPPQNPNPARARAPLT
jgi:hypothetical protein